MWFIFGFYQPGLFENAIELHCKYYNNYLIRYSCDLKNETAEITNEFFVINGIHLTKRNDNDVVSLNVYMKKMSYLSEIICAKFQNLERSWIGNSKD